MEQLLPKCLYLRFFNLINDSEIVSCYSWLMETSIEIFVECYTYLGFHEYFIHSSNLFTPILNRAPDDFISDRRTTGHTLVIRLLQESTVMLCSRIQKQINISMESTSNKNR